MSKIDFILTIIFVACIVVGFVGQQILKAKKKKYPDETNVYRRENQGYAEAKQDIDEMYEAFLNNKPHENLYEDNTEKENNFLKNFRDI